MSVFPRGICCVTSFKGVDHVAEVLLESLRQTLDFSLEIVEFCGESVENGVKEGCNSDLCFSVELLEIRFQICLEELQEWSLARFDVEPDRSAVCYSSATLYKQIGMDECEIMAFGSVSQ